MQVAFFALIVGQRPKKIIDGPVQTVRFVRFYSLQPAAFDRQVFARRPQKDAIRSEFQAVRRLQNRHLRTSL
jgi:hypothetical protein